VDAGHSRTGNDRAAAVPHHRGRGRVALVARELAGHLLGGELTRAAAALTYYAVLALLPALLVVSSLLAFAGLSPDALEDLLLTAAELGPQWSADLVQTAVDATRSEAVLGISIVFLVWTASGYVAAFMWAAGHINGLPDPLPWWHYMLQRLGLAALLIGLVTVATAVVVLAGPVAEWLGGLLGVGDDLVDAWAVLRWPFLAVVAVLVFWLLYRGAPAKKRASGPHLLAGVAAGVALMLVASAGFSLYVANWASFDEVYGTVAAGIIFLTWFWLLNLSLLVGVVVSMELERHRADGHEADVADEGGR
jgi:membrane protein